ncbi:olfactory receptor 13H1-like [Prionailurus viverrinus]|uniref:olfactory receptor 13H1-like n=1 Tax=Prionailurus viverrinus TaxID=61388 RepID=UPI001FF32FD4|nr:olfactory receptor 13H1-like [Prionailurus viverrinus]
MVAVYLITLVGNSLILVMVRVDDQLLTPMYFFLSNLYFLDICYSSNSVPFLLFNGLKDDPTIFYTSCYGQMTITIFLGMTECLLLAIMVYDRFIAISNPLCYTIIMNNQVCIQLAMVTWASAFLLAIILIIAIPAHFCGCNVINQFTCEVQALLKLTGSNTTVRLILGLVIGIFTLPLPFIFILISYTRIVVVMLRIHSAEGRLKVFSTYRSHLTVVTIFYGTAIYMYLKPQSRESQDQGKVISAFYGVVTSMLNPLIYTLRNKDEEVRQGSLWREKYVTSGSGEQAAGKFLTRNQDWMNRKSPEWYSYAVAILKIHSAEARLQAFPTCGFHLTMGIIYYGTAIFTYMCPHSQSSQDEGNIYGAAELAFPYSLPSYGVGLAYPVLAVLNG